MIWLAPGKPLGPVAKITGLRIAPSLEPIAIVSASEGPIPECEPQHRTARHKSNYCPAKCRLQSSEFFPKNLRVAPDLSSKILAQHLGGCLCPGRYIVIFFVCANRTKINYRIHRSERARKKTPINITDRGANAKRRNESDYDGKKSRVAHGSDCCGQDSQEGNVDSEEQRKAPFYTVKKAEY